MLVSYKTAQPQKLPKEHEGKSEAELNALGFIICSEKPEITLGQKLWWENNQWVIVDPNQAEIEIQWQTIKTESERRLAETDYKVIKAYEVQIPVEPEWVEYRQALRNVYNNVGDINPFAVDWPKKPL
jgi:hypothetical protein